MWRFLVRIIILAAVILGIAHFIPGLQVPNFWDALLFSFILAIINATITPVLIAISFPLTVITIGLFPLLINTFVFWLASTISYGIHITSFWAAFFGGIIVSLLSFIINQWLFNYRPGGRHR